MPARLLVFCLAALCGATSSLAENDIRGSRPNIILIVADDLGYGDLGAYGQKVIATPHLDRMAREGLVFTDFYAGATVCAPSRSVLMTGRHTGRTRVRGNLDANGERGYLLPEDVTVAEILRDVGYRTALIGKWGLGDVGTTGHPLEQGFDSFFGYLSQVHAHNYYPEFLWRDRERVELRNVVERAPFSYGGFRGGWATEKHEYSHDLFMDAALDFVNPSNDSAESDEPYFLFLALTIPHANNEATRATGDGQEVPDYGPYAELDWPPQDKGQAAMISRMDAGVGRLLDALEASGQAERTLVLFTSDNGPHDEGGHDVDRFAPNGPLRGFKRDLYDGGIRVPLVAWWPGRLEAGGRTPHVSYFGDVFATTADLAGVPMPTELDSVSFLPTLLGDRDQEEHEALYWEFYERGAAQAVRMGPWKAVRRGIGDTSQRLELYHLETDIGEARNVAKLYPHVARHMAVLLHQEHEPVARWRPTGESRPLPVPGRGVAAHDWQPPAPHSDLHGDPQSDLDSAAVGRWWEREHGEAWLDLDVPRDDVVAFALYTTQDSTLKLNAQLYPLYPHESRRVRLEIHEGESWREIATSIVTTPGWTALFRLEGWDTSRDVRYRVRHGAGASFEGRIRSDPRDQDEIVVAAFSCNSNRDRGDRAAIVSQVQAIDPDLLFFAGDQSYDHKEHTAAWLLFGRQFREILRDRPVVTIPDDHDIGQGNLWGAGGIRADSPAGDNGGYFYPAWYVNMVERAQTAHLPDPFHSQTIARGIGTYFTNLDVGGVSFAILEDRKFKTGPRGRIPQRGPRPDHVLDPDYEPSSVDLPGLALLGNDQLAFLESWSEDWDGVEMKAALSQTPFAATASLHGRDHTRLHADLDSGGWPQSGRARALRILRRAHAVHIAGDQHLPTVLQHGLDDFDDASWSFTVPAIVNNYYSRWWQPERPPIATIEHPQLPHLGRYRDGFANRMTMHAYANPDAPSNGAGFGIIRFRKSARTTTFECWQRHPDPSAGPQQFPGWPITTTQLSNNSRPPHAYLPTLEFTDLESPVVQIQDEVTGEVLYTLRIDGRTFEAPVYTDHRHTVRWGRIAITENSLSGVAPLPEGQTSERALELSARDPSR